MQWFIKCFKQYADFKGRACREEYWMFILMLTVLILPLSIVITYFALKNSNVEDVELVGNVFQYLLFLPFFVPLLAVTIRRLHDIGNNGWPCWCNLGIVIIFSFLQPMPITIISYIPNIFWIYVIYLLVKDSQSGINKYGPNPKGINNDKNNLIEKVKLLIIACPYCKENLEVPNNIIGQLVQCPECNKTFMVKSS